MKILSWVIVGVWLVGAGQLTWHWLRPRGRPRLSNVPLALCWAITWALWMPTWILLDGVRQERRADALAKMRGRWTKSAKAGGPLAGYAKANEPFSAGDAVHVDAEGLAVPGEPKTNDEGHNQEAHDGST